MVLEAWVAKMGNQVSSNLKHALLLEASPTKRKQSHRVSENGETIGILSFEVAKVMSKTVHLHESLSDSEISKLRSEISGSVGVRSLVSADDSYLLELALAEKLEELNRIAAVVSRLGKKCSEPALQGFEHVYGDMVGGVIDLKELGFLVKHMEGMVRKMDRYVDATRSLYSEMEGLSELENAAKKFRNNRHEESRRAFEQKLEWRKQDVRHLKEVSLWDQSFDKVVELLARTVCTVYARISAVFGESALRNNSPGLGGGSQGMQNESGRVNGQTSSERLRRNQSKKNGFHSGSVGSVAAERKERRGTTSKPRIDMSRGQLVSSIWPEDFGFPCGTNPGRLFMECLSLSSVSKLNDDDADDGYVINCAEDQYSSHLSSFRSIGVGNNSMKREHLCHSGVLSHTQSGVAFTGDLRQAKSGVQTFDPKSRLTVYALPSTLGGSALSLHYANIIIVVEKLLRYPHLVGEEARDDLYHMLPTSLRVSLKAKLRSYTKNLAIYDAPLAHDWKEKLDGILRWLTPLAHNMIRWQSERNFEQHRVVSRTNVLLLQTLYFADREKTEEFICELLVGLNYICRYEHQQNALLDCASSFDSEDCMEWQLQCGASFLN